MVNHTRSICMVWLPPYVKSGFMFRNDPPAGNPMRPSLRPPDLRPVRLRTWMPPPTMSHR